MSLLVSKRLGIDVVPDLALVTISPEPRLPASKIYKRPISKNGHHLHNKQGKDTPTLLLPQRRRQHRGLALEEDIVSGNETTSPEDQDDNANGKKKFGTFKRQNSRLELLKAKLAETSLESGRGKTGKLTGKVSGDPSRRPSTTPIEGDTDTDLKNEDDSFPEDPVYKPDKRMLKRRRSPSIELRSATKNVRNVVDVISSSFNKKREDKMHKMMGMNDQQVTEANNEKRTRKISMQWLSRTINTKRMSYLNQHSPDPTDLTVSTFLRGFGAQ